MDSSGLPWGLENGLLLPLAMYWQAEGHKESGEGWWLEPRHRSEDHAEHRSQAVGAKAGGVQEDRKTKIMKS